MDNLNEQAKSCLHKHSPVKPFSALVEVVHLDDARNAEPYVVCQVPRLVDTIVLLTPRPNVVEHEHVDEEILFARMSFFILVEHGSITPSSAHEQP